MKNAFKTFLTSTSRFFSKKKNRRIVYLLLVFLVALGDFLHSGLVRKTFVFYSHIGGNVTVEDRMLRRSFDRELDVRLYVEDALLGPMSPGLMVLFPRETYLSSFMLREGVVYANLTESAVLPPPGSWDVFRSLLTLNEGIRRNFSYVKDVRLFIGGNETFFEEFSKIFANSADNSKTSP